MKLENYYKLFQVQVEALEEMGVTIEDKSIMNSIAEESGQNIPNRKDWTAARNQNLVTCFIQGTNTHHTTYLRHL